MKNLFVVGGRLAWPPIVLLVFVCATIVAFDLIWRTVVISGEALMLCAGLVLVLGCLLIAGVARLSRAARH